MRKTNENTEKNTARNDSKNVKNCGGKGCGKKNTKTCK